MSKPMVRKTVRATMRLSPVRRERRRRLRPLLVLSLVLHAALLAFMLIRFRQAQHEHEMRAEPTQPSDYAVVFQSPQGKQGVPEKVQPGPMRSPASTPLNEPPPPPPPPPAPAQAPSPPAPAVQPAPAQTAAPAPPTEAPTKPAEKPPPPQEQQSAEKLRPPPPPEERRQQQQAARPAAPPQPRPARPSRPAPDFPMPMDFSLGAKPQRQPQPPGSSTQQAYGPHPSFDAPVDSSKSGPSFLYDYKQISGPPLGADWFQKLLAYWLEHRYYPPQAVANLEQGTAEIRIHVDPYGHVKETELEGRSGSMWLDGAAQSWIRNAQLQPFPPGSIGQDAVIDIRIQYELIFRR